MVGIFHSSALFAAKLKHETMTTEHPKPMIQVDKLSLSLNSKVILDQVSFSIFAGEKIAILGANGAGKTCLLKVLLGEILPDSGQVLLNGNSPQNTDKRPSIGYQASNMKAIPHCSQHDYLELVYQLSGAPSEHYSTTLERVTLDWQITHHQNRRMAELSQGNLQKLLIAQAFLTQPDLIILDEPTQNLDPVEQQRFIHNLKALPKNQTCLFSSHHLNEVEAIADRALLLHQGKLIGQISLQRDNQVWFISPESLDRLDPAPQNWTVNLAYQGKQNLFVLTALTTNANQPDALDEYLRLIQLQPDSLLLGKGQTAISGLMQQLTQGVI